MSRVTQNFELKNTQKLAVQKLLASVSPGPRLMAESQKMLARVSPCHREMVEVQKMLASLSPCLRQMAVLQKNARQCQPVSSGSPHGPEVFARRVDQVALDKVAVTVEQTAAQDDAQSDVAIVLKSEFPTCRSSRAGQGCSHC